MRGKTESQKKRKTGESNRGRSKATSWYCNKKNKAHAGRMRTVDGGELAGAARPADGEIVSTPHLQSSFPPLGLTLRPRAGRWPGPSGARTQGSTWSSGRRRNGGSGCRSVSSSAGSAPEVSQCVLCGCMGLGCDWVSRGASSHQDQFLPGPAGRPHDSTSVASGQ